jgi:hypothetical protein
MCTGTGRRYLSLRGELMILMRIISALSYFLLANVFCKLVGGRLTYIATETETRKVERWLNVSGRRI